MSDTIYIAVFQRGQCHICGHFDELRFGCCLGCSDHVEGKQVSPMLHRLWDTRNPKNTWMVQTAGPREFNGHA